MKTYLDFLNESVMRFKVGDEVVGRGVVDGTNLDGRLGTVINIRSAGYDYGVDFGESFRGPGHNLNGQIRTPTGYFVYDKNLESAGELKKRMQSGEYEIIKISPKLKDMNFDFIYNIYSQYSYIDMSDRNDTITYLTVKKSKNIPEEERWTSSQRQPMKIGRFLQNAYGCTGIKLQEYVDIYKSKFDIVNGKYNIEMVEGEDIRHWYLHTRYMDGNGTLNNSCMKDEDDQYRFDIYCENPDKIKMAILKSEGGKLMARALVWKFDEPEGVIMMDRIYTVDNFLEHIFLDYAKQQGWKNQQFGYENKCVVELSRDYGHDNDNPYMDTIRYFNHDTKELSSQSWNRGNYTVYDDH